jgi:hypothetical protein
VLGRSLIGVAPPSIRETVYRHPALAPPQIEPGSTLARPEVSEAGLIGPWRGWIQGAVIVSRARHATISFELRAGEPPTLAVG